MLFALIIKNRLLIIKYEYNQPHDIWCLVGVGKTTHTTHDAKYVIICGVHSDLSSLGALNGGVGENKLKGGVVNTREVARAAWLMLFGAKSKRVHVDTLIRVAGVGLVRLDPAEVGSFTLREAILTVELELGSHNGVLSPAVKVKRGLRENEGSGIRDTRVVVVATREVLELGKDGGVNSAVSSGLRDGSTTEVSLIVGVLGSVPVSGEAIRDLIVNGTSIVEKTTSINVGTAVSSNRGRSTEGMDSVGESINGISVVEGLGTEHLEEEGIAHKGRAVVHVLVRLHNPDKLLHGVVEVELDLVGGGTNRLVTSELELSDEVLVRVLGKSTALISVKEHVVNVERSGNKRLVVGDSGRDRATRGILVGLVAGSIGSRGAKRVAAEGGNGPEALINRTNVKVDLDLVVLEGNKGKSETRVGAEPELEGHVEGGLGKSVTGSANLARSEGVARAVNLRERGIGDEGKLGGVTNHLEVATLLFSSHGELVPDVHPVTILAVNALTTDLNLNLSNELLTGEVKPAGIDTRSASSGESSNAHKLVNLGESNLEIGSVSKITISADRALNTATEVSLAVESLFNRLNGKVGIATISHFPESNLRITCTFPLPYFSIRIRLYLKKTLHLLIHFSL